MTEKITVEVSVENLEEVKELRKELERIKELKKEIKGLEDDSSTHPTDFPEVGDPNPEPMDRFMINIDSANNREFEAEYNAEDNTTVSTEFEV